VICVVVSDRMVSLCLRRSDDKAEGQMVLSTVHTGKEEETVAALFVIVYCVLDCFS